MKLKHKLQAQIVLLFVVVIFFGGLTLFYLRLVSKSTDVILIDNYATLKYINEMRSVLDENDLPLRPVAVERFRSALRQEQKNITERGEATEVNKLSRSFEILTDNTSEIELKRSAVRDVHRYLLHIEKMNLNAVEQKSQTAKQTIKNATMYLAAAACITFLVLFSFIFNLASSFEDPQRELKK